PDHRALQILKNHHYPLEKTKRAQQITPQEIQQADYLIAMSQRVADELGYPENTHLLMGFVENAESLDIPDPYPSDTFLESFLLIEHGVKDLYTTLKQVYSLD
ncbi:MAG: hypothetical protein RRA35_08970, partial [Desulfomonilia bacterium]|nr:hypothetical protein [Desulfomonilia bacterium]